MKSEVYYHREKHKESFGKSSFSTFATVSVDLVEDPAKIERLKKEKRGVNIEDVYVEITVTFI